MPEVATLNSTNVIELVGLRHRVTGEYLTDATAVATLYDSTDTPVTGAIALPLSLVGEARGSRTMYRGAWPAAVSLTEGAEYTLIVTATDTDGDVREFVVPMIGQNG